MRWHILKTLLVKEAHRHLADRGGIFLAVLLICATLLLSLFGKDDSAAGPLVGGVRRFYVDYEGEATGWIEYLRRHEPESSLDVRFRSLNTVPSDDRGVLVYEQSTAAVQLRLDGLDERGRQRYQVMFWQPGKNPTSMSRYVTWFWQETIDYYQDKQTSVVIDTSDDQLIVPSGGAVIKVDRVKVGADGSTRYRLLFGPRGDETLPFAEDPLQLRVVREELKGRADERSLVATGLVIFALCFFCVYMLPTLTCEERERGVLLAQMLSPASSQEILAAKFLFYPAFGMTLAAVLAGIYNPHVLVRPFFWLTLVATSVGYLGIGMTIASLARTQRLASLGTLCYMLTVALLLFITQRFGIPSIQYIALEYYCPRIMHAVLEGTIGFFQWMSLAAAMLLACGWVTLATVLFRKRGWQ
ncbi:MAG: ABC transporter permease [Planctomycetota bacterium]|nr:ABC transporter permease [Planctomycetota bacterium]